jgi:hypothetical protein
MVTSDDMLSESKRPQSIVFIGGGVISLEFGHVYARAGSSVTILEALPQLLPAMDSDAVARLRAESERIGLQISTGVRIERIKATADDSALSLRTRAPKRQSKRTGSSMARVASPTSKPRARRRQGRSRQWLYRHRQLSALNLKLARLCLRRCGSDVTPAFAYCDL